MLSPDLRRSPALLPLVAGAVCALVAPDARAQHVAPDARAQHVAPRTEDEIFHHWIEHSREVVWMRSQVRGARFDVVTSTLWPNPQVTVNFLGTPAGVPPDGRTNYGLQVQQALPVFGQVSARRDAAVAALAQSEVAVATLLWSRASDLASAMVDRAYGDARVHMLQQNLAELTALEQIIARRVNAGAASQYDTLRVEVSAATLRAEVRDAELERDRAEGRVLALVGDASLDAAPVTREGLAHFHGPETLPALLDLALRRRPDLELARRGVATGLSNARRWTREAVPTPSFWLGAYATHDADSLSVTAGLSVPIPLFDRNQGLVGRARAEAEAQQSLAEATEARIRVEVATAWRARQGARTALDEFRAHGLATTLDLLRRAEFTYQSGASGSAPFTIQDLFDAYRTLWDARAQELALEETFVESEADLERVTALIAF